MNLQNRCFIHCASEQDFASHSIKSKHALTTAFVIQIEESGKILLDSRWQRRNTCAENPVSMISLMI